MFPGTLPPSLLPLQGQPQSAVAMCLFHSRSFETFALSCSTWKLPTGASAKSSPGPPRTCRGDQQCRAASLQRVLAAEEEQDETVES